MACGSGCCGPPAADSTVRELSPPIATEAQCKDKYCDAPEEEECQGSAESEAQTELDNDCCAPQPVEVGCNKGCCSVLDPKRPDGYSIPDPTESGCNKGCCSQPQLTQPDDTTVPSCCEGKPAPCCDQSCLDRLALRDCGSYVPDLATSPGEPASPLRLSQPRSANLIIDPQRQPAPAQPLTATKAAMASLAPTMFVACVRRTLNGWRLSAVSVVP
jgi:Cu2+-exporting ATPase